MEASCHHELWLLKSYIYLNIVFMFSSIDCGKQLTSRSIMRKCNIGASNGMIQIIYLTLYINLLFLCHPFLKIVSTCLSMSKFYLSYLLKFACILEMMENHYIEYVRPQVKTENQHGQ